MVEGVGLSDQLLPCFRCNLALIQAFPFSVHVLLAVFLFPPRDKLKSLSLFFLSLHFRTDTGPECRDISSPLFSFFSFTIFGTSYLFRHRIPTQSVFKDFSF